MKALMHLLRDESGQDLVEYGLLAAFISIVTVGTLRVLGPLIVPLYERVQGVLSL